MTVWNYDPNDFDVYFSILCIGLAKGVVRTSTEGGGYDCSI